MAAAGMHPNATVWGLRDGVVLVCFRAQVDASGHITHTGLNDPADLAVVPDRDTEVQARLRRRYGEDLELRVALDGGAGFAQFQQDLAAHRRPTPPPAATPSAGPAQPPLFR